MGKEPSAPEVWLKPLPSLKQEFQHICCEGCREIKFPTYILHMNNVKIVMSQDKGLDVPGHGRASLLSLTFSGRLCLQRRLPNFLHSGGLEFYRINRKPVRCPPKY